MTYLLLPVISFILLLYLFCAGLPFVAFTDKLQALRLQRSVFAKSSWQLAQLAAVLQVFGALALSADLLLEGCINSFMQGVWRPIWLGTIVMLVMALIFSIMALIVGQIKKPGATPNSVCLMSSGLTALLGAALAFFCVWIFLRGGHMLYMAEGESLISNLAVLLKSTAKVPLVLYMLICLVLSWVGAHALALVWYLVLRRRDDFGRDYYSLMLRTHARHASTAGGLILLPLMVGTLGFIPTFSSIRLIQLLPWTTNINMVILSIGTICLPLAVACWFFLYRSELPLRNKALVVTAIPLVWVWFFSLLGRVWI